MEPALREARLLLRLFLLLFLRLRRGTALKAQEAKYTLGALSNDSRSHLRPVWCTLDGYLITKSEPLCTCVPMPGRFVEYLLGALAVNWPPHGAYDGEPQSLAEKRQLGDLVRAPSLLDAQVANALRAMPRNSLCWLF